MSDFLGGVFTGVVLMVVTLILCSTQNSGFSRMDFENEFYKKHCVPLLDK